MRRIVLLACFAAVIAAAWIALLQRTTEEPARTAVLLVSWWETAAACAAACAASAPPRGVLGSLCRCFWVHAGTQLHIPCDFRLDCACRRPQWQRPSCLLPTSPPHCSWEWPRSGRSPRRLSSFARCAMPICTARCIKLNLTRNNCFDSGGMGPPGRQGKVHPTAQSSERRRPPPVLAPPLQHWQAAGRNETLTLA